MRNRLLKYLLLSSSLLFFPLSTMAQHQRRTLVVDGRPGQAIVAEIDGRPYVEIAGLAEITHGSLSFKADRIVLSLPPSSMTPPPAEPPAEPADPQAHGSGLSREFMRAGIEEIATMREWASTLAYAIENGYHITDEWAANYREQAAHDLRLASVVASTEADRNALQLLTHEFETVRDWSNKLVQERKSMDTAKYALSENALRDDPISRKIVTCGHFLATMFGSGSFDDNPSCH
jgi:hypothetical protein